MASRRDPFDALRQPPERVAPDAAFAAHLRARIERALDQGAAMTSTRVVPAAEGRWPPTLTPYIGVHDARRAIDWYVEVFDGHQRGEVTVMPDGSIGHAEVGIGDAVLMLAEYGGEQSGGGPAGRGPAHTIHVQVPDARATVDRAVEHGATLERPVSDEPYGRVGVIVDPFGHRWMVNQPPATATRVRPGDVAYVTLAVPDDAAARNFYGDLLAGPPHLAVSNMAGR